MIRAQIETGAGFVWEVSLDTSNTIVIGLRHHPSSGTVEANLPSHPQIDMTFVETMLRDAYNFAMEGSWFLSAEVDGVELGDEWLEKLNESLNGGNG